MKTCFLIILPLALMSTLFSPPTDAAEVGCATTNCHAGLMTIVPEELPMMQRIRQEGQLHGDPDGCVVCHGGNPKATTKEKAHQGIPASMKEVLGPKAFYPDPGSIWISGQSCGQCHPGYTYRAKRSLMNTEAGTIQGNLHTWGLEEVAHHNVPWGNYDLVDDDGPVPLFTVSSKTYKKYMRTLLRLFPKQFPSQLKQVPKPTLSEVKNDPKRAALTYQRQECQRCHIGVKGRKKRGDYRGMGCSACHIPYSNEGYYEGDDKTINKKERGHLLKHRIVGNRKTGGIPVENCNSCHNRGKRIGVSFQGLMEFPYGSPYDKEGKTQPKLHTKSYLFISDDLHHQMDQSREGNPVAGLLCQDCHTTIGMHGDGNIHGTTLAQVEIECSDCHGTPEKYPWELPIGFNEEFGRKLTGKARGLSKKRLIDDINFGYPYNARDGYLLTSRGNPFGNVVKNKKKVILHSATGLDFTVPVLKNIAKKNTWKNSDAQTSMASIPGHIEKMECYTCHASWAPQCYGCHVQVDYSKDKSGKQHAALDWVASGNRNTKSGQTAESTHGAKGILIPGKITEKRSYLRWEDPLLGINGEGRISPLMPGCQVAYTVIDEDGKTLAHNVIAQSRDESTAQPQKRIPLAIDMAPVQPHTAQRKARPCESCHANAKVAGLGIGGGSFGLKQSRDIVEELVDATTGEVIPSRYSLQIPGIPDLLFDWSQIVTRDGTQLATVGTHWPMSRPFNKEELDRFLRAGTCIGCHRYMGKMDVWKRVQVKGGMTQKGHEALMGRMLKKAAKNGLLK